MLDHVHFRPVHPAQRIGRQAVVWGVDDLGIRHRGDSVCLAREVTCKRFRATNTCAARPVFYAPLETACATGTHRFKRPADSVDEPLGISPQVAKGARLGNQDGIDRDAQLGGNCLSRSPVDHVPPERPPGGGPEVGLDQLQEALQNKPVVLPIPTAAQIAGWVCQLIEHQVDVGRRARVGREGGATAEIGEGS